MKQLFSALCIGAIACTPALAADFTSDGIAYSVIAGTATPQVAVDKPATPYSGKIVIPEVVSNGDKRYQVTEIATQAFAESYTGLETISLPEGLETIRKGAFSDCSALSEISIPNSVTRIEDEAFAGCISVTRLRLGEKLQTIGDGAFKSLMMLTELKIPDSVVSIGHFAFQGVGMSCSSLTLGKALQSIGAYAFFNFSLIPSITLPEGIKTIGDCAFEQCNSLTSFHIPSSAISVGRGPVSGEKLVRITVDEANPNYTAIDGVLFDKEKTIIISYPAAKPGNTYVIPSSVRTIGMNSFARADNLTSITFPEGVTTIENAAFYMSANLASVTTPASLRTIGNTVFYGCGRLGDVNLSEGLESIGSMAFAYCWEKLLGFDLPATVKTLGEGLFYCCDNLKEMEIPVSVKELGKDAFNRCISLKKVKLNEGLEKIGADAFAYCQSLEEIIVPNTVTSLGIGAFFSCTGMKRTTLGSSLTSLPAHLYDGCEAITEVTALSAVPPSNPSFPMTVYRNATLRVPQASLSLYKGHMEWGYFSKIESLASGIEETVIDRQPFSMEMTPCGIRISGAEAEIIDTDGRIIAKGTGEIDLPAHGIYIVRSGRHSMKIAR